MAGESNIRTSATEMISKRHMKSVPYVLREGLRASGREGKASSKPLARGCFSSSDAAAASCSSPPPPSSCSPFLLRIAPMVSQGRSWRWPACTSSRRPSLSSALMNPSLPLNGFCFSSNFCNLCWGVRVRESFSSWETCSASSRAPRRARLLTVID